MTSVSNYFGLVYTTVVQCTIKLWQHYRMLQGQVNEFLQFGLSPITLHNFGYTAFEFF